MKNNVKEDLEDIITSSKIEGYELPDHVIKTCESILKGEITVDKAINEAINGHTQLYIPKAIPILYNEKEDYLIVNVLIQIHDNYYTISDDGDLHFLFDKLDEICSFIEEMGCVYSNGRIMQTVSFDKTIPLIDVDKFANKLKKVFDKMTIIEKPHDR